jgi:hypothetical protein
MLRYVCFSGRDLRVDEIAPTLLTALKSPCLYKYLTDYQTFVNTSPLLLEPSSQALSTLSASQLQVYALGSILYYAVLVHDPPGTRSKCVTFPSIFCYTQRNPIRGRYTLLI